MKILRIINKQGLFIRDDFTWDEETEIGLDVEASQGLYLPKWNGEIWEEGATQEYIDSLRVEVPHETLNLEEKVLEHEEKIVTLEETLDVLFGGVE